jgi:hypothetical protein
MQQVHTTTITTATDTTTTGSSGSYRLRVLQRCHIVLALYVTEEF